jgi:hypothetical protein
MKKHCVLVFSLLLALSAQGQAEEITEKMKAASPKQPDSKVQINYSFDEVEEAPELEVSYYSGIERLFKNPALVSGLSNGTAALNRSIESLMEAVFYSLLDNELIYDAGITKFAVMMKRDVFNTTTGNYVVVDHFSLGPRHLKELHKWWGKLPLNLQADASTNIFNIYPRSDGQRLAEREDQPYWRMALSNWLGLLPFFTRILPPSFNPNELYDPVTQLTTPFSFPTDPKIFMEMPIGSIRSYSANASVALPVDIAYLLDQESRKQLETLENLKASLPVKVFVTGEHRISVLRRSEHTAWVGLSNVRRAGGGVSAEIGRTLQVLSKISKHWAGVPMPLIPVDFDITKAKALRFDQLYEFDLRNKFAQEAYRKAVDGDFTLAHQRYLDHREQDIDTGVVFHFKRNEDAIETDDESNLNLFVFRRTRDNSRSVGEVEITDPDGRFNILETRQETDDEIADVLMGTEQIASRDSAQLKVIKKLKSENPDQNDYEYVFSASDQDPISLSVTLSIQDKHVDAEELENYLRQIRKFTRLKLSKIPEIPNRDADLIRNQYKFDYVANPTNHHRDTHVTPTYLGQFNANASVVLSTQDLNKIASHTENEIWSAFAKAFDQDSNFWKQESNRNSVVMGTAVLKSAVMLPLKVFNIRSVWSDFYWNARGAIAAILQYTKVEKPKDKLELISKMLASSYSDRVAEAMLLLTDLKKVPRSVSFFTSARGNARDEVKSRFRSINNQVVKSVTSMPESARHKVAEEKLSAFYPSQLKQRGVRPLIHEVSVDAIVPSPTAIDLNSNMTPESPTDTPSPSINKHIQLQLRIKNVDPNQDTKFYVRIENAGELQVGRFVIAEQVVKLAPNLSEEIRDLDGPNSLSFRLWLSGPLSPLKSFLGDQSVAVSGNVQVHISASNDGKLWSEERLLRFRFEDGNLMPL